MRSVNRKWAKYIFAKGEEIRRDAHQLCFRYVVFDNISVVRTHMKSCIRPKKKNVCLLSLVERK